MKIVIDIPNKDFSTIIRHYHKQEFYKSFDFGNLISMIVWEKAEQIRKYEDISEKMKNIKK